MVLEIWFEKSGSRKVVDQEKRWLYTINPPFLGWRKVVDLKKKNPSLQNYFPRTTFLEKWLQIKCSTGCWRCRFLPLWPKRQDKSCDPLVRKVAICHTYCVCHVRCYRRNRLLFSFSFFFPVQTLNKKTTLHRIVLFFGVVFSIKGHWLTRLIAHKLKFIFSEKTTKYKKKSPS